jgi:hydrogenase maturation factor HypF (carbamoyltransferase family)
MNSLSVLLYAASVSENLSTVLGMGSIISLAGTGGVKLVCAAEDLKQPKVRGLVIASLIALTVSLLLPSKQTVYMIAASETAERVGATPEAREMMDLLRRKIIATLSEKT